MKIIVGLGNSGKEYEQTRHNAGFMMLNQLQKQQPLPDWSNQKKFGAQISKNQNLLLAKPQTMMNASGRAVAAIANFYQITVENDLLLAFDDLDLEVGVWKLQKGRGPHGHNGVDSVYAALDSKDFWHLRIGIDGRAEKRDLISPKDYVLQKFLPNELELIQKNWPEIIEKSLECLI